VPISRTGLINVLTHIFRSTSTYICKWREIFKQTYNRKSSIVVKKTSTIDFYRDRPVTYTNWFKQEKNQTVCTIGPVCIIGT